MLCFLIFSLLIQLLTLTPETSAKSCGDFLSEEILPPTGIGRGVQLSSWFIRRTFGLAVPFEGQKLSYYKQFTPKIFWERPINNTRWVKYSEKVKKYARSEMTREEAKNITEYYSHPGVIYTLSGNYYSKEDLLRRFPRGYKIPNGRSQGAFQFEQNLEEGLDILVAFDEVNDTNYAFKAGMALIKNFPERNFIKRNFSLIINQTVRSAEIGVKSTVREFFRALADAKAPANYLIKFDGVHHQLKKIFDQVIIGDSDLANAQDIEAVVERIMVHRLWISQTDLYMTDPNPLFIVRGLDFVQDALSYFEFHKQVKTSSSNGVDRIISEFKQGKEILENELERIRLRGELDERLEKDQETLFELQKVMNTEFPRDIYMLE